MLGFSVPIGPRGGIKASTLYRGSPYKLRYEVVGLNCSEPIPDMLNMFTPHPFYAELRAMKREELIELAEYATPWENLLRDQVPDLTAYNYIYNWLAHLFQFPGMKMGVLLGMYGPKGTGKNTLMRPIQKLFGRHYIETSDAQRDVLGEFSELLEDKLVVCCNEAFWGGKKDTMGALKHLITEETIVINTKGVGKYTRENVLNILIMSNNERIVPAEEDERRYAIFELTGRYSGSSTPESKEYFTHIRSVPTKAVLAALLLRDLSGWDPMATPKTDALRHQQSQGLNAVCSFWENALKRKDGTLGSVRLSEYELAEYNVAHQVEEKSAAFDESTFLKVWVPGMERGRRTARYELLHGIPRIESFRQVARNRNDVSTMYKVTVLWSHNEMIEGKEPKIILKKCSLRKTLIYKIFEQWRLENMDRFRKFTSGKDKFWAETARIFDLQKFVHRPRELGSGKDEPDEFTLPTQEEGRQSFATRFMKDKKYFNAHEYELDVDALKQEYDRVLAEYDEIENLPKDSDDYRRRKAEFESQYGKDCTLEEIECWYDDNLSQLKEKYERY